MRQPPANRIAKKALRAWRISSSISHIVLLIIVSTVAIILTYKLFIPKWYTYVAIGVVLISAYISIAVIPKVRWWRWRYEVFDQEIYIQHGLIIVSRTLVPMIRVQHVDTKQGPILKKFGLATVMISTAATTHQIPALLEEDASNLRDMISRLARVGEDDV